MSGAATSFHSDPNLTSHIYLVNTQLPLNKVSDSRLGGRSYHPTNTQVCVEVEVEVDHGESGRHWTYKTINTSFIHHCYTVTLLYCRESTNGTTYLVRMSPVLVLGSVGGVAEGLGAPWEFAHVGLLSSVGPQVGLEVLQATVGFPTSLELKWLRFSNLAAR